MIYFITNQTHIQTYNEVVPATLEQMFKYFESKQIIGVDTETEGFDALNKNVLLIQLGDYDNQFVIDCTTIDLLVLKDLLEDQSKTFIYHNAKFDLKFLYKKGIVPHKNVFDTFLAESVLTNGDKLHRKSLQDCVKRYLKVNLSKEERGLIHRLGIYNERIIKYSALDVKFLENIMELQLEKAERLDLMKTIQLENRFVSVLTYVEFSGIKLDREKWLTKSERDLKKMISLEEQLDRMVENMGKPKYLRPPDLFDSTPRCGILWSSQKQVIPLFEELGLNLKTVDKKTKKEKKSIESNILKSQKHVHEIIPLFLEYQKAAKLVSTYGMNFLKHINKATNRVHTNFRQIMDTGRLSSGKDDPKDPKPGEVNMQNIPGTPDTDDREEGKIYERECFIAEDNNTFIVADYSGQETMVLCYYAQDDEYTSYVTHPDKDLHSFMASLIFSDQIGGLSDMEIKKNHSGLRKKAKPGTFSIPYGGNGFTIANNVGISEEKGNWVYEKYMEKFSGLNKYFEKVQEETISQGYVLINPKTGRKCFLKNRELFESTKARLEAYSTGKPGRPFQGLSAGFWAAYRPEKEKNSDKFKEMKALLRQYFSIKGNWGRTGLNYPIQGTSADMSKLAGIKMFDWIMKNGLFNIVKICVPLHDEYCLEAPKEMAEQVANMVQESMESAAELFCPNIGIKASPVISSQWEH